MSAPCLLMPLTAQQAAEAVHCSEGLIASLRARALSTHAMITRELELAIGANIDPHGFIGVVAGMFADRLDQLRGDIEQTAAAARLDTSHDLDTLYR